MCVRNSYWQQQRQREEDILIDLDSALCQHLSSVTDANSHLVSRESFNAVFKEELCAFIEEAIQDFSSF